MSTRAYISREASQSYDVTIVGKNEYADRLGIGIKEGAYQFPLLLADGDGLFLSQNQFQIRRLTDLFSPRLKIDWQKVPTRFVPIDGNSAHWEVAEVVMPRVLQYMAERRPLVRLEDVCQDTCNTWGIMGLPAKGEYRTKVREVLREASRLHFKQYLRWLQPDKVEIIANPLDLEPDRRSATFRKLKTAQTKFIDSLKTAKLGDFGEQLEIPFQE